MRYGITKRGLGGSGGCIAMASLAGRNGEPASSGLSLTCFALLELLFGAAIAPGWIVRGEGKPCCRT